MAISPKRCSAIGERSSPPASPSLGKLAPSAGAAGTACAMTLEFRGPPSNAAHIISGKHIARVTQAFAAMALGKFFFDPPAERWHVLIST
jgi:hypothetical protein